MPEHALVAGSRVLAVVVTYDRPKDLRDCVDALLHQTHPVAEILIIDNGGPQGVEAVLPNDSRLHRLRIPINTGGAGGFSRGVQEALQRACDWIWLLDDDAIPRPESLERLIQVGQDAALTSPPVLFSAVQEFGTLALRHRRRFDSCVGLEWSIGARAYEAPWVSIDTGSFVGCLIPRVAAEAVAPPSADFFLAFDDTEYSLRLKTLGIPRLLVPGSLIDHRRTTGSRLREGPFAGKHFLNIRNHLVVKQRYARIRPLSLVLGMIYGLLVFLRCGGLKDPKRFRWLLLALWDGVFQCLGPPPQEIQGLASGDPPEGLVVILRTQGLRPLLLDKALDSALCQKGLSQILLLVHGDQAAFESVSSALRERRSPRIDVISVPDRIGDRAYPLNVALDRLYRAPEPPLAVTFLDDDDWLDETFSTVLLSKLKATPAADVILAGSRSMTASGEEMPAYAPLPAPCLLIRNFMPINSYLIRFSSLRKTRVFFDEGLPVLEDWSFLQRLLMLGFTFDTVSGSHSGFRLLGDGNQPIKRDQGLWDQAWQRLHEEQAALLPGMCGRSLAKALRRFDFSQRPPLSDEERALLEQTLTLIETRWPGALRGQRSAWRPKGVP